MGKQIPEIDEQMIRQIEELAGYGLSMPQIAAVVGFSERTLHRRKNDHEAVEAALARGRARAAAIVGKALFQRAKDGDIPAIRWWEMTREGRSERSRVDAVDATQAALEAAQTADAIREDVLSRISRLMASDEPSA